MEKLQEEFIANNLDAQGKVARLKEIHAKQTDLFNMQFNDM